MFKKLYQAAVVIVVFSYGVVFAVYHLVMFING